jgi:carboxypeptidase Taq
MGQSVSLGVHESQSRLWENSVGRGRPFWKFAFPQAKRVFRDALHDVELDRFLFAINEVRPSLIRVQADEVTYSLHIIIRFELERALLGGDLAPGDLPGAWTEKYQNYLNVTPANDAEGCLQDIHWSAGLFGYFPTYTLGNVFAAQLFDRASHDLGDLPGHLERGEFSGLLSWLRTNIHQHGKRWWSDELITRAVGTKPDPKPFLNSLHSKFKELYGL